MIFLLDMEKKLPEDRLDRMEKMMEALMEKADRIDEQQKRTDAQLAKSAQEYDERWKNIQAQSAKTDAQLAKTDERLNKTIKKLDDIGIQLANIGFGMGDEAEEMVARQIRYTFQEEQGIEFYRIEQNLKKKGIAEYDIVAVNTTDVMVLEVKHRITKKRIDDFIQKSLPRFKIAFPEFSPYRVIAGIGGKIIPHDLERYAVKQGLFVITQPSKGMISIANPKGFQPKVFA